MMLPGLAQIEIFLKSFRAKEASVQFQATWRSFKFLTHKGEPWLVFANCLCTFPLQPTSLPREFIKQCKIQLQNLLSPVLKNYFSITAVEDVIPISYQT